MAALERIGMLRQLIEMFRRANFSENTSLRGNVVIQWGTLLWVYKFYTVLPNQGRGVAPVFLIKLQFPKELERSSLLLDKNC